MCLSTLVSLEGVVLTRSFVLGYEYAFGQEKDSKHTDLLAYFPSDEEISFAIKEAKKYASSLAAFVGMHDNAVFDHDSELSSNLTKCDGRFSVES